MISPAVLGALIGVACGLIVIIVMLLYGVIP